MGLVIFVGILLVIAILLIMLGLSNERRIERIKGFHKDNTGNPGASSVTKKNRRNKKDIG